MKITVEISLYPLQKKYKKPIKAFIRALKDESAVTVRTTAMSTYLSGDYDVVMKSLTKELKRIYEVVPASATVVKIVPMDLQVERGFMHI